MRSAESRPAHPQPVVSAPPTPNPTDQPPRQARIPATARLHQLRCKDSTHLPTVRRSICTIELPILGVPRRGVMDNVQDVKVFEPTVMDNRVRQIGEADLDARSAPAGRGAQRRVNPTLSANNRKSPQGLFLFRLSGVTAFFRCTHRRLKSVYYLTGSLAWSTRQHENGGRFNQDSSCRRDLGIANANE
jgi:hypothetical protein